MKRYCVVGGLGFIGSHLVDLLLRENQEVIIVDNKSSNVVDEDYFPCPVHISSIQDFDFSSASFDVLIHLASVVGPVSVIFSAGSIADFIVNDTKKLAEVCIEKGVLFVDISTSEVYGHEGRLLEDTYKKCEGEYSPRMEYGMGKLAAEIMVGNLAKVKSLSYHIIRPFNVSGACQKPDGGFVLPRFVISALTNQPLTVYGDGSQVRSIASVKDICSAIYKIICSSYVNEVWNIGNPNNLMSIKDLAKLVISLAGRGEIEYYDPQVLHGNLFQEVGNKIPCIHKIQSWLNWSPVYTLGEVIQDVFDYYVPLVEKGYKFNVL